MPVENILFGDKHWSWKGGREVRADGYVMVYAPDHPRAHKGKVREHILVMERKLGRYLRADERVHHLNHNRSDNREENLELTTIHRHRSLHSLDDRMRGKRPSCPRCGTPFPVKRKKHLWQCLSCDRHWLDIAKWHRGQELPGLRPPCPRCGNSKPKRGGYQFGIQRWCCRQCGRQFRMIGLRGDKLH